MVHSLDKIKHSKNTEFAINHLSTINPNASAKNINYPKMVTGFCLIFFLTLFLFTGFFNFINNLVYLIQNLLKAFLFQRSIFVKEEISPVALVSDDLPIYSILIPLYKEELKAKAIVEAMVSMNYPKEKLDVKLIIENDDILTKRALAVLDLPLYIEVIGVPYSFPRTKPKALNYAIPHIKGKFLAIYDAEDTPDPDQLLKAIYAFRNLPDNVACLQARLNFYNADKSLLTKLFSMEYSLWFNHLLRALSISDLPVTLGGTSNHFKVDKLAEVGYWDAYNVTEDADLGIRLYLNGYKVHLINSVTMEESPSSIFVWLAQRARWTKGFFQTAYVFMKAKKDLSKFGRIKIFTVYVFVGFSTYSFLTLPWLLFIPVLNPPSAFFYMWAINIIFSFVYMYGVAYFTSRKSKWSLVKFGALIIYPFYFILHTIASYRAVWEIVTTPFKWNKTPHGEDIEEIEE
jgi:cellulose synthase/poly-beta-1,6-N-acetylglucosamine synthase-like glycosyltransferase